MVLIKFSGITCQKVPRPGTNGKTIDGDEYGDEALTFTKEKCLQREVIAEKFLQFQFQ